MDTGNIFFNILMTNAGAILSKTNFTARKKIRAHELLEMVRPTIKG